MLKLSKYSIGVGDRFAHEAEAQLRACMLAADAGVEVVPVWNKSNREHSIIGSEPAETRAAADAAVKALRWTHPYFVDADHIRLETFERFVDVCDFFTIDVADRIGQEPVADDLEAFVARHPELDGSVAVPRIAEPLVLGKAFVAGTARHFLAAVKQAGVVYRAIEACRANAPFVVEISMDETERPQTPAEMLVLLAAVADEGVPIQTFAPKFTGRFNKGVDYVGDVARFAKEFREDLATVAFAVKRYGLPENLKLSVHSGSDKYSIYPAIHAGLREFDAGVHVKTAGTTWLEELIGLAEVGGEALALVKEIYSEAYAHADELCAPYRDVVNLRRERLPEPGEVDAWSSEEFVRALRHGGDGNAAYNPDLRQLLHVGFKIAAGMGARYVDALKEYRQGIARNVTENLFERHIRPIFLGSI